MKDDDERRPGDLDFAREIGASIADSLSPWRESDRDEQLKLSGDVLGALLRIVNRYLRNQSGEDAIPRFMNVAGSHYILDLNSFFRLLSFYSHLDGILTVRAAAQNAFDFPPVLDMFNPRALRAVFDDDEISVPAKSEKRSDYWRRWSNFLEKKGGTMVEKREATIQFMTLFTDSLRAAVRSFATSNRSNFIFEVRSNLRGYQLEYYPQYNYSPVVFGSTLTTPVYGTPQTGHYKFQGWHNNQLTIDTGVYLASPTNTVVTLRDF